MNLTSPADKETAAAASHDPAPDCPAAPGPGQADSNRAAPEKPGQHWPALDGLRAVAICAVIATHLNVLPGGYLGVDVFFVLSGFLITSLLISEWDTRGGTIRLRDFYARRALRLLPALGCVIVAAAAVGALLDLRGGHINQTLAGATFSAIPWVVLFAGNFVFVLHSDVLGWSALGALSHTWSLAIEEQFYLLWPGLFLLAMRRGIARSRLALVLAALAVTEMIYRAILAHAGYNQFRIYYGTDTHSDGLLMGCALACWLASRQSGRLRRLARTAGRPVIWLASLTLLTLFVLGNHASQSVDISIAVLTSGVLVTAIVLGETPPALERLLRSRFALRTGTRSYGLYLWHFILLGAGIQLAGPWADLFPAGLGQRLFLATVPAVAIAGSFVVADLSYRFVELPALRLKRRFQNGGTA